MLKNLVQQFIKKNARSSYMSVPFDAPEENEFLKKSAQHALDLYERKSDINKFSKLVLSDPENESQEERMKELFATGKVRAALSDDELLSILENERFLKDLGLE